MTPPLVVNATFMLSGLLGLQLQVPDGSGHTKTIESSVPFNISPNISSSSSSMIFNSIDSRESRGLELVDDFDTGKPRGSCGRRDCNSAHEICVTWQNVNSTKEFKECLPADNRFSSKSNPIDVRLCPSGQTHKIMYEPRLCLRNTPPCELKWKYVCVEEEASPHSCKLRKCPPDFLCLELVHCEREPPCVAMIECHHLSDVDHHHG